MAPICVRVNVSLFYQLSGFTCIFFAFAMQACLIFGIRKPENLGHVKLQAGELSLEEIILTVQSRSIRQSVRCFLCGLGEALTDSHHLCR
jgi:hypothetical protein